MCTIATTTPTVDSEPDRARRIAANGKTVEATAVSDWIRELLTSR